MRSLGARRWRVTYQLADEYGLAATDMIVRAGDEAAALELARERRAAWELERARERVVNRVGVFDDARVRPYTTADGMDDGTSWASVAIMAGLAVFTVLAIIGSGRVGGTIPWAAFVAWRTIEVVAAVGGIGYVLYGVAALIYAGVTVLRERGGAG